MGYTDSEKKWLFHLIKQDLEKLRPSEQELEAVKPRKPKSEIQGILQEFMYAYLYQANGDADCLDKFNEDTLQEYKQKWRFFQIFDKILTKAQLLNYAGECHIPEIFKEACFALGEKLEGNDITLEQIQGIINQLYPDLIQDPGVEDVANNLEAHADKSIDNQLERIKDLLATDTPLEETEFENYALMIEQAKDSQIGLIAQELDKVVVLGNDLWKAILYGALTPYAPPIEINSVPTRNNIHILLIGEISSGKSKVFKILKQIAPKAVSVSKFTEASFEGIAHRESIEKGLLEDSRNGILIVPEFISTYAKYQIMRETFDCDTISITKMGMTKHIDVNTTIVGACNPKLDFFSPNFETLREQVTFQDGILSRFDVMVPLTVSKEKNEKLLDHISLFGCNKVNIDFATLHNGLKTLAEGMTQIKQVSITQEHEALLKKIFRRHNVELKTRPLLILRDLEILARLVNVITCVNFHIRTIDDQGIIYAEDTDVLEAIELWETLIFHRKQFYESANKDLITVSEKIVSEVYLRRQIESTVLEEIITQQLQLCSRATYYRKVNNLVHQNKLNRIGDRNSILVPA